MRRSPSFVPLFVPVLVALLSAGAFAQGSKADYERANGLRDAFRDKVFLADISPRWIDDNRFWYRRDSPDGREFVVVNAVTGEKTPAFDHRRLASRFAAASGEPVDPIQVPFEEITFSDDGRSISFQAAGNRWTCNLQNYSFTRWEEQQRPAAPQGRGRRGNRGGRGGGAPANRSPDGRWEVEVRDHDLFLTPVSRGRDYRLTNDGVEGNAYGSATWSPDSRTVVAYRIVPGDVQDVYLIETSPDHQLEATLRTRPYPRPGDRFPAYEMYLFSAETRDGFVVDTEVIDFRGPARLRWQDDSRHFTYEKRDRGHQRERIMEVNVETGRARTLVDERAETFIDDYHKHYAYYVNDGAEIIWASERDGWNHLYLYDGQRGEVKHQITKGAWLVRGVDRVDEEARQIWFTASGMVADQDPYLVHNYRINFDGTDLVNLTEGNGDHSVQWSPDRTYFVDTYSRVDLPTVTELRRSADGSLVMKLEEADVTQLQRTGWTAPEVFSAKGRDGVTDIWGIIHRPTNFDPSRSYPVVEYIYAGPHDSHVPKTFSAYRSTSPVADLGFIVVQIDGMGTNNRSKAFHDVCWQNIGDAGFPDRILWIEAAAEKYPYMDLERVGIYGTSAGGQNSMGALLFHPEFYQVAVSSCGCHDNRLDKASWNEQWMGYPVGPHYAEQSNITNAHKLEGELMLILGELDTNVPPESTYRVVDALIEADKDFDFIVVPGMGHSGGGNYGERRRRDFFVRHLLGVEPRWQAASGDRR